MVKVCIEFLEGITVPFSLYRILGGNNSVIKVCKGFLEGITVWLKFV